MASKSNVEKIVNYGISRKYDLTIGLVVHNESDRIQAWLDHWTQFDYPIIIVDQSSTDDTVKKIPQSITVLETPHYGIAEPDRNIMEEYVDGWLLCVDVDEFMSKECIERMLEIAATQPTFSAWWIRWINWIDGRDISAVHANPQDQPGLVGCDWHVRLSKGPVVYYDGTPHQHPQVKGRWGVMDGNEVWMDHRRTWKELLSRNRRRNDFMNAQQIQMQEGYIQAVAKLIGEVVT